MNPAIIGAAFGVGEGTTRIGKRKLSHLVRKEGTVGEDEFSPQFSNDGRMH